jgi:hypothetical protein
VRWQHLYDVVSGWDKTYLSTTHERFLGCVLPRESHRGCSFVIPLILRAIGGTYHLYIYIWPMQGLNFREHPHKIWPYMVQYLHFRIQKFPLRCRELQKKTSPRHQRPSLVRHQWCEETVDDTFPQHASGNWGPVKDHRSQQGLVAGSKVGSDSLLPWKELEFPLFSGLRSN